MVKLSQKHKEAIQAIVSSKKFADFADFLKVQRNNTAIIEWARTDSLDPQLAIKKAKFEGKVEFIKDLFTTFDVATKSTKEE